MKKRILTVLLAVCLVFALGTVTALADGSTTASDNDVGSIKSGETTTYYTDVNEFISGINSASENSVVTLLDNIEVTLDGVQDTQGAINLTTSNITINGGGHKITAKRTDSVEEPQSHVINVSGAKNISIGNLVIDCDGVARHGIHVFGDSSAKLDNITITGYCKYGVVVNNGASVEASELSISSNVTGNWGNINVDAKSATASLTLDDSDLNTGIVIESNATNAKTTVNLTNVSADLVKTNENSCKGESTVNISNCDITALSLVGGGTDKVTISNSSEIGTISTTNSTKPIVVVNDSEVGTINKDGFNLTANNSSVGGTITNDSEARIGNTYYATFEEAWSHATDNSTIMLMKDVTVTGAEFTLSGKNVTVNGGNHKLDVTVKSGSSDGIIAFSVSNGTLTFTNVNMTVNGTKNSTASKGYDGTGFNVGKDGKIVFDDANVTVQNIERATTAGGAEDGSFEIKNGSDVTFKNIDGNASNGGNWTVSSSDLTVDTCGSYGLSVENLTTSGNSNITVEDTGYGAIYALDSINISGNTDIVVRNCGDDLPRDSDYGDCVAPIQLSSGKILPAGYEYPDNRSISIGSSASVVITGCDDNEIYVVKGTSFTSSGYVKANVEVEDNNMNVVTLVDRTSTEMKLVEYGDKITLPKRTAYSGHEFLGWKCSVDGEMYDGGDKYTVKRDVTFTAVWEDGYKITIDNDIKHGDVTTNVSYADEDDVVYIYVDPDTGYVLDTLKVTYGSRSQYSVKTTYVRAGVYKFTMPDAAVTISATFKYQSLPFTDVKSSQWFYDEVYYVYTNGMMEGDSATTFNPDGKMTRAMFWAVLGRIDGEEITGNNWANEARAWAMKEGVSDGTNPNAYVTREQMVTMLWRYAGEKNGSASLIRFTDANKVSDWAVEAMRWAISNGIIDGMTSSTLAPQGNATRAQCAAIFMRYDQM